EFDPGIRILFKGTERSCRSGRWFLQNQQDLMATRRFARRSSCAEDQIFAPAPRITERPRPASSSVALLEIVLPIPLRGARCRRAVGQNPRFVKMSGLE